MTTVEKSIVSGVTVLTINGDLTTGVGDVDLHREIDSLSDDEARAVVIDCSGIERADASGIGALVRAKANITGIGGRVVLSGVQEISDEVLEIARLIGVFDCYDNVDDAVASFPSQKSELGLEHLSREP